MTKENQKKIQNSLDLTNLNFNVPVSSESTTESDKSQLDSVIPIDIQKWLIGEGTIPAEIKKLGLDVAAKINWYLVYVVLSHLQRVPQLYNFIKKSEEKLYDISILDEKSNLGKVDIKSKYESATKELDSILEFTRKLTLQNKSLLTGFDGEEGEKVLLEKVRRLDKLTIDKILKLIDEAESNGSLAKQPE